MDSADFWLELMTIISPQYFREKKVRKKKKAKRWHFINAELLCMPAF